MHEEDGASFSRLSMSSNPQLLFLKHSPRRTATPRQAKSYITNMTTRAEQENFTTGLQNEHCHGFVTGEEAAV